ncbi:MAG: type I restriction enzyme HsdR N-terminal domain-containing protein [Alistipes sp.]|nr:type I restriction enzyme HsdR N-terminal domain-containing protein [Alistipes sp.]
MKELPQLTFPPIELSIRRRSDGYPVIPDKIRGGYLVLTPEEWVRRHLIGYLVSHCGAELRSILTEYPIELNGTAQRADVVVLDNAGNAVLLAECKAADVKIDKEVLSQAVRYNSVLKARYIVLTNGRKHYCYEQTESGPVPLKEFPRL